MDRLAQQLQLIWKDDKLQRRRQADLLERFLTQEHKSQIARGISKPQYVLNIDASWGLGKTFFLDRWKKQLEAQNYIVLHYDAWANDFSKDPLLSFLGELAPQLLQCVDGTSTGHDKDKLEFKRATIQLIKKFGLTAGRQLFASGLSMALGMSPGALRSLWESSSGEEGQEPASSEMPSLEPNLEKAFQSGLDALANQSANEIFNEEESRKRAVRDFRESLESIVNLLGHSTADDSQEFHLPVFVFIDELDRCRPDFTIELIECVKHIFSVGNVFFVFASDSKQLQAALEGTYGQRFDAETYFNRIFSRQVHLSEPDYFAFAKSLVEYFGLDQFEDSCHRSSIFYGQSSSGQNQLPPGEELANDIASVSGAMTLSLRSQFQMVSALDTLIKSRPDDGFKVHALYALILIVFWQQKREVFYSIKERRSPFNLSDISQMSRAIGERYEPQNTRMPPRLIGAYSASEGEAKLEPAQVAEILIQYNEAREQPADNYVKKRESGITRLILSRLKDDINKLRVSGDDSPHPVERYFYEIMMTN